MSLAVTKCRELVIMNSAKEGSCLKEFLGQVRETLETQTTAKTHQYNFDFAQGLPGAGRYQWLASDTTLDRDGRDTADAQHVPEKLRNSGQQDAQKPCDSSYNTQP